MPLETDCNENVLRRFNKELPNGAMGHFTSFRMFDPAIMIDCTPLSDTTNVHLSEALFMGVYVRFTRHTGSGNDSYFVSLNGGGKAIQDEILARFQQQLHIPVANFQNVSFQGSDTYEWVVERV